MPSTSAQPGWAQPGWAVPGSPGLIAGVEPVEAAEAPLYATPIVPHLALPLTIGPSGGWNMVAQDTAAEVCQSVGVLLGTAIGSRTMVPSYGVTDPTFSNPNASEIVQAISQWEPRADATVSISPPDASGTQTVNVKVALVAGGS